eukprot:352662-Chlamydomonas_euryale.AAC.3
MSAFVWEDGVFSAVARKGTTVKRGCRTALAKAINPGLDCRQIRRMAGQKKMKRGLRLHLPPVGWDDGVALSPEAPKWAAVGVCAVPHPITEAAAAACCFFASRAMFVWCPFRIAPGSCRCCTFLGLERCSFLIARQPISIIDLYLL